MSGMATKSAVNVRALILEAVPEKDYHPTELLLTLLSRFPNVTEGQLKDELSALITEGELTLTSDRFLVHQERQKAAS
jgi:hypothetical protein